MFMKNINLKTMFADSDFYDNQSIMTANFDSCSE